VNQKKYKIEFEIKVPENVNSEDVEKWARFMVGDTGKLSQENPLYDVSFDPILSTFKIEVVQ